ncbi:MAG: thioesterase domain-containing protein, partial [Chloroflexota bacterium]
GLARGYHKRPDITAERFIDNPFGEGRVYRTGDLVRYPAIDMDSPPLEFLGRLDHQVKIRGFRVELGEIEAVLTAHDDVHEAVVMTYEGSDGSPLLAAYLIPTETNLAVDALPIFLRERLPAYMLPNTYIPLDAFPLTPNGKINRLALPKPQQKTPAVLPSSPSETPQTPLESTLVNLWQEILGVDTVGIHDNFFMLGGHSLLAAQFVTRAKAMGLAPTVQQLTQHPTIAELSVSLQTNSAAQSSLLVPIKPTGTKPPLFLIHPVLGMVYPFMPLAQYLHKEQPLYGIRASGIERGEPVLSSVPEVAVRYITEIQTVQPDGPYHLGGWSFGGWVAHEMATQLTAQGHEVGLLAMLDTPFRSPETPRLEILRRDLAFFRVLMREIVPYANSYRTLMAASDEPVSLFQQSMLTRVSRVYRANNQATRTYVPTDYDGDISVFRASQQFHAYDETMSWGANHARPVDVAHIPGNHMTIFREPHIQYLVEELQQRLS